MDIDSMFIVSGSIVSFKKYMQKMDRSSHKDVILGGDFGEFVLEKMEVIQETDLNMAS